MNRFQLILASALAAAMPFIGGPSGATAAHRVSAPAAACTVTCYVNPSGNDASDGDTPATAKKTIQAAINQVSAGGQVRVMPGNYHESAPGSMPTTIAGTYQFGLFFGSGKPGITLMGVTAGDVPITDPNATLATITTDATNSFGTDGIFVEAANTTIQGVKLGPNDSGDNKTIEVVGDNFTLRYATTAIPGGGGSIYIDDFSPGGTVVQSYHVLDNAFLDGTSVDVSSGAGNTGPVAGREILGNVFDLGNNGFNAISFNGSGGVPWFTLPVGGAVIKNNSFANSNQYIRARGVYDISQFDWQSYWNDNTFDRATVALVTQAPFDVRTYAYGAFVNVRRIGGTIQEEVDHAVAGDTVLAKAGTYTEDVVIATPNLKLLGAGMNASVIVGPATGSLTTLEISGGGSGSTIDGFMVTRAGNNPTDWTTPVNNQGVAIYGSGSTLQNSKITGNRNGVFLYGATNVTIKNNTIDFNRTGIHLVNNVTGLMVKNNFITNNWTIGVLFRDESSPNPTGAVTIKDNNISGNWYSQVEARSLFSAPALNVENNWLGTTTPSVFVGPDSGEPGYAGQIPVAYGGTAVPPMSTPTIIYNGANLSNPVDYNPFRCSGVDASPAIGFQPLGGLSDPACTAIDKANIRATLAGLLLTAPNKETADSLRKAIEHIDKSLAPNLWADASHLTAKGGVVFDEEKRAVEDLMKIKGAVAAPVGQAILGLVGVDRQLAQTVINEEPLGAARTKALVEMAKAEASVVKGEFNKAIDHFKHAWDAVN